MAVEPIRDERNIEKMKKFLKRKSYRDYAMFMVGLNSGLRISDILRLRVRDVRNKTHITIRDLKTQKRKGYRKIKINFAMQDFFNDYTEDMDNDDFLFKSRNGENKPITRQHAYRILNEAAHHVGIEDIGTHTMRKTMGYHHYQRNRDVVTLQKLFNHSSPSVTLAYIGITQDELDESMDNFLL